jgi:hypothetical protein
MTRLLPASRVAHSAVVKRHSATELAGHQERVKRDDNAFRTFMHTALLSHTVRIAWLPCAMAFIDRACLNIDLGARLDWLTKFINATRVKVLAGFDLKLVDSSQGLLWWTDNLDGRVFGNLGCGRNPDCQLIGSLVGFAGSSSQPDRTNATSCPLGRTRSSTTCGARISHHRLQDSTLAPGQR